MIVSALIFVLAVESWAQDFDVASDASAIGNTTTSPMDALQEVVDEHTKAIAALSQKMNEMEGELIRCESGYDAYRCPWNYHFYGGGVPYRDITFNRAFVNTPTVIIAVKKAVDDFVAKPIWHNIYTSAVSSTGFSIHYYLRPTTLTKPTKTYALTMWMACGH